MAPGTDTRKLTEINEKRDRRRIDMMFKAVALLIQILVLGGALIGIYVTLQADVGGNAAAIRQNRESLLRLEGQQMLVQQLLIEQGKISVTLVNQETLLKDMRVELRRLANK